MSETQKGHSEDGLSLLSDVWVFSREDLKAEGDSTSESWNHLETSSVTCLAVGSLLGLSARTLMHALTLGFFTTWQPWDS